MIASAMRTSYLGLALTADSTTKDAGGELAAEHPRELVFEAACQVCVEWEAGFRACFEKWFQGGWCRG